MKRSRKGWPPNSHRYAADRQARQVEAAMATVRPAARSSCAALTYWRDKLWQAAESVGVKLTDDQLEAMSADLVVAAKNAPEEGE